MLLLKKTQKEIERIDPKLIVHANKGSLYYWGLNPTTYQKDYENPWLNYDFNEIDLHDCPPLEEYAKRLDSKAIPKRKGLFIFTESLAMPGVKIPIISSWRILWSIMAWRIGDVSNC